MCDVKKECVWLFGAKEERKSKMMVSMLRDLYGEWCSKGVRVKAAKLWTHSKTHTVLNEREREREIISVLFDGVKHEFKEYPYFEFVKVFFTLFSFF